VILIERGHKEDKFQKKAKKSIILNKGKKEAAGREAQSEIHKKGVNTEVGPIGRVAIWQRNYYYGKYQSN
jgi:hypothetical protein